MFNHYCMSAGESGQRIKYMNIRRPINSHSKNVQVDWDASKNWWILQENRRPMTAELAASRGGPAPNRQFRP